MPDPQNAFQRIDTLWRRLTGAALPAFAALLVSVNAGLYLAVNARQATQFDRDAKELAQRTTDLLFESPAAGASRAIGMSNLRCLQACRGTLPPDEPSLVASLTRVRIELGASMVYVMNRDGLTVASSSVDVRSITGNSYRFRPYFERALAGHHVVYMALGVTTLQRGLYYAAPVADPERHGQPAGVVVIKTPVDEIEAMLRTQPDAAALVSPLGVVYCANRVDWLYATMSAQRLTPSPHRTREYHSDAFASMSRPLGARHAAQRAVVDGRPCRFRSIDIPLEDPDGRWRLHVYRPLTPWSPVWLYVGGTLAVAGVYAAAAAILALMVTRRRSAIASQALLRENRDQLERMVLERTSELVDANAQLRREMAERIQAQQHQRELTRRLEHARRMEALGLLAGGVAHDLNNSLTPVLALPTLLREELSEASPDLPRIRRELDLIEQSAEHAVATIRDLLSLGRRGTVDLHPMDLNDLLVLWQSSVDAEEAARRGSNVALKVSPFREPLAIQGSEPHLLRVLTNLVLNAVDAVSPPGHVGVAATRVHLDAPLHGYETVPPGVYARLAVSDSGCGIAPSDLPRIFEPFFSRKKTSQRRGTGLGLSVVHGITKDHGGFIGVESAVGRGTTFYLYLPLTDEARKKERT